MAYVCDVLSGMPGSLMEEKTCAVMPMSAEVLGKVWELFYIETVRKSVMGGKYVQTAMASKTKTQNGTKCQAVSISHRKRGGARPCRRS